MHLSPILFIFFFITLSSSQLYRPQQTQWQKQQRLYIQDPYCIRWNGEICAQCSLRYFTQNQRCIPVNPLCNHFSSNTGDCLSCYAGYQVSNGLCTVAPQIVSGPVANSLNQMNQVGSQNYQPQPSYSSIPQNSINANPGCASFNQNGICIRCSDRQYNDSGTGNCKQVSDFCKTWHEFTGDCLTCYPGFELANGGCFGNYNPGQTLTVRGQADKKSDQSLIIPLGSGQVGSGVYTYPPVYNQISTQPISSNTYSSSPNSNQYQNQNQQQYIPITPAQAQPQQITNPNQYLQQISQLQPLPTF